MGCAITISACRTDTGWQETNSEFRGRPTVLDSPGSGRSGARSFQPSACQKAARMSQLSTNHRRIRRGQMHRPRCSMQVRRDRSIRRSSCIPFHSIHPPRQQSTARRSVGARCLVPGLVRGRGLASAASPARDAPGPPLPGSRAPTTTRARASQQRSRPCSRPRPPGSHCARTATRVPTARGGQPVVCVCPALPPALHGCTLCLGPSRS